MEGVKKEDSKKKATEGSVAVPFCLPPIHGKARIWYLNMVDVRVTPSVHNGYSWKHDLQCRQNGGEFINRLCSSLNEKAPTVKSKIPRSAAGTAMVYFHRFFMIHSFKLFDPEEIAAVSVYAACKVWECAKKLDEIVYHWYRLKHARLGYPGSDSKDHKETRKFFMALETFLLRTLGKRRSDRAITVLWLLCFLSYLSYAFAAFELQPDIPHVPLLQHSINLIGKEGAQVAYSVTTDIVTMTNFIVRYRPTVIACIAINLTISKLNLPSIPDVDWYKKIDMAVTPKILKDLTCTAEAMIGDAVQRIHAEEKRTIELDGPSAIKKYFNARQSLPTNPFITPRTKSPITVYPGSRFRAGERTCISPPVSRPYNNGFIPPLSPGVKKEPEDEGYKFSVKTEVGSPDSIPSINSLVGSQEKSEYGNWRNFLPNLDSEETNPTKTEETGSQNNNNAQAPTKSGPDEKVTNPESQPHLSTPKEPKKRKGTRVAKQAENSDPKVGVSVDEMRKILELDESAEISSEDETKKKDQCGSDKETKKCDDWVPPLPPLPPPPPSPPRSTPSRLLPPPPRPPSPPKTFAAHQMEGGVAYGKQVTRSPDMVWPDSASKSWREIEEPDRRIAPSENRGKRARSYSVSSPPAKRGSCETDTLFDAYAPNPRQKTVRMMEMIAMLEKEYGSQPSCSRVELPNELTPRDFPLRNAERPRVSGHTYDYRTKGYPMEREEQHQQILAQESSDIPRHISSLLTPSLLDLPPIRNQYNANPRQPSWNNRRQSEEPFERLGTNTDYRPPSLLSQRSSIGASYSGPSTDGRRADGRAYNTGAEDNDYDYYQHCIDRQRGSLLNTASRGTQADRRKSEFIDGIGDVNFGGQPSIDVASRLEGNSRGMLAHSSNHLRSFRESFIQNCFRK